VDWEFVRGFMNKKRWLFLSAIVFLYPNTSEKTAVGSGRLSVETRLDVRSTSIYFNVKYFYNTTALVATLYQM